MVHGSKSQKSICLNCLKSLNAMNNAEKVLRIVNYGIQDIAFYIAKIEI